MNAWWNEMLHASEVPKLCRFGWYLSETEPGRIELWNKSFLVAWMRMPQEKKAFYRFCDEHWYPKDYQTQSPHRMSGASATLKT